MLHGGIMKTARKKSLLHSAVLLAVALVATPVVAEEQTVEFESREGFVDAQTGARVEAVDKSFWTGKTRVLVSVPAADGKAPLEIEEVLVTAKRPEKPDEESPLRYEFVNDFSNDRYGMYIYLGKDGGIPFRIYFKDTSSEVLHNR
jgi:hypothetical protein